MSPASLSALLHGLGAPLLIGLERLAWYGSRSLLVLWLLQPVSAGGGGWPEVDIPSLMTRLMWMGALSVLAGGVAGALVGPYAPMVIGALLATLGYALLGAGAGVWGPLVLLTLGSALIRPNAWAALAQALPTPREHLRAAAFVGAYACVNAGAVVGSLGAGLLEPSMMFVLAAVVMLPIPVLAVGLGWVEWRVPLSPPAPAAIGQALGVALAAVVLVVPFWALIAVAGDAQFLAAQQLGLSADMIGLVYSANPVLVLLTGVVLALALTGAHFAQLRWPPTILAGVAMTACSLGALALHPSAVAITGYAALGVGVLALSLTEVAIWPLLLARVTGDNHHRAAPLLAAAWLALATPIAAVANALTTLSPAWTLLGTAALSGAAGVLLVAGAIAGRRWLMPPLDET